MMRSAWPIFVLLLAFAGGGGASAQEERGAFGDWARICEPGPGGQERCYILQTVKQDDRPVMVVIVAYSPQRDRVGAMIDVPLGMHIPTGLEIRTGDDATRFPFEQCLPVGCRALVTLDDAMLAALKAGQAPMVAGKSRDGAEVQLPISANGFEEAFGGL